MKKILLLAVLLIALFSTCAYADQTSHRQAALTLMEMFNMRQLYNQMLGSFYQSMAKGFNSTTPAVDKQKFFRALVQETEKILAEVYPYEEMRDFIVDIYVNNFSEKELNSLLEFYKSPAGQKILNKMPQMTQEIIKRSQTVLAKKAPEVTRRVKAFVAEYKKKNGG